MKSAVATVIATVAMLAFPGISLGASLNVVPNGPEGVTVTCDQASVFRVHPLELVLGATKHGNGGGCLHQQIAPAPAVLLNLFGGQILLGDIACGAGDTYHHAVIIKDRHKDVFVVSGLTGGGRERCMIPQ